MSTFKGVVDEFPDIRIDYFRAIPDRKPPLACFLSHIHSDHLMGLDSLRSPFVYCSPATRELLLRLEEKFHRMNRDVLEYHKRDYSKLKGIVKTIPLETPTKIELRPRNIIQVTLLDANHCSGAVMFLIEDERKAILYTGDIRSEPWWVNALVRNPAILPYTTLGPRCLDKIYLDTTFASGRDNLPRFPSKADGLLELLGKILKYPKDTVFHFHAWTPGYEEVWIALANTVGSKIHVDEYKMGLYTSLRRTHTKQAPVTDGNSRQEIKTDSFLAPEAAALVGHHFGNNYHAGCLTSDQTARIHSCERGTECSGLKSANIVWITPILTRTRVGMDIPEIGAGGGAGDLTQGHQVDLSDANVVVELLELCLRGEENPMTVRRTVELINKARSSTSGQTSLADLNITSLDRDVSLDEFADLVRKAAREDQQIEKDTRTSATGQVSATLKDLPRKIQFPYSRHSSYDELCHLVSVFQPKDIYPCTTDEETWCKDVSIQSLFGNLCSGDVFCHDVEMEERLQKGQALGLEQRAVEQHSSQPDLHTSSQASEATERSRDDEKVKARLDETCTANAAMPRRPDTSPPYAKRRRTAGGSSHSFHTAGSHPANDSYDSTFSADGRLKNIQRSFESFFAQPSATPPLPHSISDPSPLLPQPGSKSTTPTKEPSATDRRQTSVRSPLNRKGSPAQSSPAKPGPKVIATSKVTALTGTQSRPVELDSDSDKTTDDDRTPTNPWRNANSTFDGVQEQEEDLEEDTQVTLPDSAFDSQDRPPQNPGAARSSARVKHRKAAYKAAKERDGLRWEGLISSGNGHGEEELEL